jgi:hypothetical protein
MHDPITRGQQGCKIWERGEIVSSHIHPFTAETLGASLGLRHVGKSASSKAIAILAVQGPLGTELTIDTKADATGFTEKPWKGRDGTSKSHSQRCRVRYLRDLPNRRPYFSPLTT